MLKELMYKWFGLDPPSCLTCDILREQLSQSNAERRELLVRLLDKDKAEPPPTVMEEMKPMPGQFVPWRVRQQMLEAEDRKRAELMRAKQKEMHDAQISELEKELDINHAS